MSENYGPTQGPGPVPNYGGPGYGPPPSPGAPKPAKKPIWKRTWAIALAAGIVGLVIGAGSSGDTTAAPKAAPTVTVTATETAKPEAAPTVTVTATAAAPAPETSAAKPEPVKNADPATTAGLTEGVAVQTCGDVAETGLKNTFPGSKIKVHSILGVLAADYKADSDSWFVKIEGKVDDNRINIECTVTGSDDNPSVDDVTWY